MWIKDSIIRANAYEGVILERSGGCWLWDTEGNKYLDMESGVWCCNLGHGHPEVVKAAKEQMDKSIHIGSRFLPSTTLEAAGSPWFMPDRDDILRMLPPLAITEEGIAFFQRAYLKAIDTAGRGV